VGSTPTASTNFSEIPTLSLRRGGIPTSNQSSFQPQPKLRPRLKIKTYFQGRSRYAHAKVKMMADEFMTQWLRTKLKEDEAELKRLDPALSAEAGDLEKLVDVLRKEIAELQKLL
jgi:hypothetical protein